MQSTDLLVIDDDAEMGAYVELALAPLGLSVRVECALGGEPIPASSAALVDLMLAGPGDGLAAVRRLAADRAVVLMTGLPAEHPDVQAARKAGARDVLSKPFGLAELRACVLRALGRTA